jgi:hypothetical protein
VSWYFRAVQTPDETWLCRWGNQDFDQHATMTDAIEHLTQLAAVHQPAVLFVHWRDGSVSQYDWPEPGGGPSPR